MYVGSVVDSGLCSDKPPSSLQHYDLNQVAQDLVAKRKVWAKKYLGDEFVDHFSFTDLAVSA